MESFEKAFKAHCLKQNLKIVKTNGVNLPDFIVWDRHKMVVVEVKHRVLFSIPRWKKEQPEQYLVYLGLPCHKYLLFKSSITNEISMYKGLKYKGKSKTLNQITDYIFKYDK